ncbi:hypothetical protein D3C78_1254190 [compost metagenome]
MLNESIRCKSAEAFSDVLYDVCAGSTGVEGYGLQLGTLCASWEYGSVHDGERHEVRSCEPCFFMPLARLGRERLVSSISSDGDEDLNNSRRLAHNNL